MHKIVTTARARGAFKLRIDNPAKFLEKLIGNNVFFQTQVEMNKYFREELTGKIKASISRFLNGLQQELIGIDAYLDILAPQIEPYINETLTDYGLKLVKFSLSGLDIDLTKYDMIDVGRIEGLSDVGKMEALGQNYLGVETLHIMRDMANNPGGGGAAAGMGMGLGAGAMMGGAMSTLIQQSFGQNNYGFNNPQFQSGGPSRFAQAGTAAGPQSSPVPGNSPTPQGGGLSLEEKKKKLDEYKQLLDLGYMTPEEFETMRKQIVGL